MTATEVSGGMQALMFAAVGDLPPRSYASIDAGEPVRRAIEIMCEKGRGAVLIEEDGALVGIFTERDVVSRVDHTDPASAQVSVRDVMTPHPTVIRRPDSLAEALRRLIQGRRRHLPIIDDKGKVVGLLSIRDILTYVASKFPEEMVNLPPNPDRGF